MLKDITLGQYFPGNSFLHRMDARVKLLLILVYIVILFTIKSIAVYALFTLFTAVVIMFSQIPLITIAKSVRPMMFFIVFTAIINIFMTPGDVVLVSYGIITITADGIVLAAKMVLRFLFLIIGTSMLTFTTEPLALTDSIERLLSPFRKIGVPAHELAMMMSIAIRFIPTLLEETEKIMKAQMARGADFESGNILKRSKALIPILVPLFISAFRRADDLATAMECRCYRGGDNRTRMKQLKMTVVDLKAGIAMTVFTALVIVGNILTK